MSTTVFLQSGKKQELLTVFDDMIVDMISKNKLGEIVFELFIRGRKLNTSSNIFGNYTKKYQKVLD